MDGENNGKPYEQMDDLGGNTLIFGSTPIFLPNGWFNNDGDESHVRIHI